MQQVFAHISDPHLTQLEGIRPGELAGKRLLGYLSWRRKRRFEHRRRVLDALTLDLQGTDLTQLVITGDLTHVGTPAEFAQAREWLETLGDANRVTVVPGNHDACVRAPWEDTFGLWRPWLASDSATASSAQASWPSLRVRGQIAFIGLSSACPTPPLMASGTVSRAQLEQLPELLDDCAARGLFRVVYLHHAPLPGSEKWRKRLTNAAALSAVLAAHGAELVLHGHGHRARTEQLTTCSGAAPVIAVPSASALGLHGGDVASYNLYRVEGDSANWKLSLETRRFDRDSGSFQGAGEPRVVGAG